MINGLNLVHLDAPTNHIIDNVSNMISGNNSSGQYVNSYDLVHAQNIILENNIKYISQMYSTDKQNILYQTQKIDNYRYFNKILVIIYFILMGISAIFIVRTKKIKGWIIKIVLISILVMYPFFIYYLESYLYEFFSYMISFLNGETYTKTMIPSLTNTKIQF